MHKNASIVIAAILTTSVFAATIAAASYNVQTAKAKSSNLGQSVVSPYANGQITNGCPILDPTGSCNTFNPNNKGLGSYVSGLAQAGGFGGTVTCLAKNPTNPTFCVEK